MTSSSSRPVKRKSSSSARNTVRSNTKNNQIRKNDTRQAQQDKVLFHEIGLIILFVVMLLLFLCNFGLVGPLGDRIRGILFGIFGFPAYVTPVLVFLAAAFWFANEGSPTALRKLVAGVMLYMMAGVFCELISGTVASMEQYDLKKLYDICSQGRKGGGALEGSLTYLLQHNLETIGTVLVALLISVICLILLTEKSFLESLKRGSSRLQERILEEREYEDQEGEEDSYALAQIREQELTERSQRAEQKKEAFRQRRREFEQSREEKLREKKLRQEELENDKILRMDKKVSGVTSDTTLRRPEEKKKRSDVHEIMFREEASDQAAVSQNIEEQVQEPVAKKPVVEEPVDFETIKVRTVHPVNTNEPQSTSDSDQIRIHKDGMVQEHAGAKPVAAPPTEDSRPLQVQQVEKEMRSTSQAAATKAYRMPPLSLLEKGVASSGDSSQELRSTAERLRQTLQTFGVNVKITEISQGPSVTRYELSPEQGVKVSKIVGLADDIKLNLAATDIRIEAPIPGKAAVGIEVPNKENMMVALRDLLESKEFKEFPSNLAFAVGKDIGGKTVVADIAKMPHMLIAGATGSGKSVCINTLIMSILYKARPEEVKLIMVDPKVVELSVYNGIPHLLIPVVTDPKKASAALHWAVSEMEERYRKFADFNVRDLKGYNKKLETMRENGEDAPANLPQIVIIVDELADLMMVSPGEVEDSICRLAQLARACGIHLIIATQRPSVDVITGLIKANMPSRVAFAVSSGVDSRTILDMVGAEKLLGKGDMLFYPQGYTKPARIQGAFVSDKEVTDVVEFLKNQKLGNVYAEEVEAQIRNMGASTNASGMVGGSANDNGRDEYFAEAGRFVIDKDKASIGMLQRVLKIGFNRAARIMDQLCDYGVVGEEEGTKPRKVLMTLEQFEQLLEEI